MKKLIRYLNPVSRLGKRKYSILFPLLVMICVYAISEIFVYGIARNPNAVGAYIIFISSALIIYFAFRDGMQGGFITSIITIAYYFYIIYTRHYAGAQKSSGIETTIILAVLFFIVAGIIGGLKQKIDRLIEREADERRRLQAIVQQLPVGVLLTDKQGRVIQGNKQIDTILGIKIPVGFTIGKDFLSNTKINGKPLNPAHSPLFHALSTGKSVVGKEYQFQTSNGKTVYLKVSSAPITNKHGRIIAAASIISDITKEKEMEARKDDFVNMASHELKTPITSMKLYIDSLSSKIEKTGDERTVKTLSNIKNQTRRLQKLVNDLLDVSRLQTGKLSFHKEKFRLDKLIEEAIDGMQDSTNQQKILFSQSISIFVHADKFRVYQILANILTNAIKYSVGTKKIIVKLKKADGKAIVSIQDFGIGIAKEQQKKIFDRLYQVTDDKEKTFPGFGMGLYISKEIIRRHKGSLWVESEKDKGSTYYFSIPIENS